MLLLHIEWMTQRHHVESVKDDHKLDNQFMSLLGHCWMEEALHAKLDASMAEAIVEDCGDDGLEVAVQGLNPTGGERTTPRKKERPKWLKQR